MHSLDQIKLRNDTFRKSLRPDSKHRCVLTESVSESPNREEILEAVKNFDSFSGDNDPHGEHDFGSVIVGGEKYFFKFDYYDLNYEYGADQREEEYALLLTIMHASDY